MNPKPKRHVGGSLLASNEPRILEPIPYKDGTLQVRVLVDDDTHGLYLGDELLAMHPNGYSCHVLAERMVKGDNISIHAQADYIVACGGVVTDRMRSTYPKA